MATVRQVIADALSVRQEQLSGEASPLDYDGARLVLDELARKGYVVIEQAVPLARRERIYEAIATGIWSSVDELSPAQVVEAYRVADLVLAADPQTDDGAATARVSPAPAVSPTAPSSQPFPRRFLLYRHRDVSGMSGTGVVAEGVQFTDSRVALRWRGEWPSTVAWDDIELILGVHGHQGATELRWIDPEPHVGYWPVEEPPR